MYIHVDIWPSSSYSLATFSDWINGAKLVLTTSDVVTVALTFGEGVAVESCSDCKSLLVNSQILDSARALNWKSLDDIILKRVVSICMTLVYIDHYCA